MTVLPEPKRSRQMSGDRFPRGCCGRKPAGLRPQVSVTVDPFCTSDLKITNSPWSRR